MLTLLIFRTRAEFIQPSLQLAARVTRIKSQGWWAWRREQRQLNQPSGGGPPPPFELSPGGRAWVAIFWKNLICAGTRYTPRMFSRCMLAAIVVGLALGNWPGLDPKVPATLSGVVLYIVVILGLMVSQHVRNDLRLDIPNFIYLRSLPISGFGLLLGEVLGLALILGGMATIGWTFCACAVTQVDGTMLPLLFRVPVFFAGLAMIAALALAWVCVENCLALAYPGWTQLGPLRGGGLDKMGQSMLSALIRMLVLMGALVLPMIVTAVVVALGVMLVGESLVGIGWVALVGALVAGPIIAAEALAAMWFCGKRIYPKFDISVELV